VSAAAPHLEAGRRPGRRAATLRLLVLFLLTDAATLTFVIDWASPVRVVLVLGFLLLVPGLALTELLGIDDPVQQLALAASASLAVETLVAVALLYAGQFSADLAFAIVAILTCAALAATTARAMRAPAANADPGGTSA
jgi:uncharacterized membrane protein